MDFFCVGLPQTFHLLGNKTKQNKVVSVKYNKTKHDNMDMPVFLSHNSFHALQIFIKSWQMMFLILHQVLQVVQA